MATYGPHGLAIPEYPSAADGPAAFQQFAASVEGGLYGTARDEADRDTRYADIPVGRLVTSSARRAVWLRVEGGWLTVWQASEWQNLAYTAGPGFDISYCRGRKDGADIEIRAQGTRTGAAIGVGSNGNIPGDPTFLTITTSGWSPGFSSVRDLFGASYTSGQASFNPSGSISIMDAHPNSAIDQDSTVTVSFTFKEGS